MFASKDSVVIVLLRSVFADLQKEIKACLICAAEERIKIREIIPLSANWQYTCTQMMVLF